MKKETNYTNGPWKISEREWEKIESGAVGIDIDSQYGPINLATVWTSDNEEDEGRYNAHLIAAAPELLDALIEIREWYENNHDDLMGETTPICFSKGLSAILKATLKL